MHVIEKFGISYVPSASILRYCQAKNKARTDLSNYKPAKCVLVCSGTADDYKKFEEDINIFEKFDWDSITPLKGEMSSKENLESKIAGNDVIHFATHGLFAMDVNEDPLDSGLLLTSEKGPVDSLSEVFTSKPENRSNYFLSAREIFKFGTLNCNLVTIRACSSGRSQVRRGDELIGLTRAFLYAGAPSLLVSLWNVNIKSSGILLAEFYRLWLDSKKRLQKWKALQQAQISVMKISNKYSHPYHWAPIILIGDWL
jgi:CHAT domain-containing protein